MSQARFRPNISDLKLKTTQMSNRQYAAMRLILDSRHLDRYDALFVDQRSWGSLFHRGWICYEDKEFKPTALGKQAMTLFETTNVIKDHAAGFSGYIRTVKALADYQWKDHREDQPKRVRAK